MKKLVLSALILGTSIVAVPAIEAKTTSAATVVDPQIRVQIGRNRRNDRWNRRVRVVTTTRVRRGFTETIRTTYLPNGTTRTQVIRRVRFRG